MSIPTPFFNLLGRFPAAANDPNISQIANVADGTLVGGASLWGAGKTLEAGYEWFFGTPWSKQLTTDTFEKVMSKMSKTVSVRWPSTPGVFLALFGAYGSVEALKLIAQRFLPELFERE